MAKSKTTLTAEFDAIMRRNEMRRIGLQPFIVVDLFCGAGGASQGLLRALELAGVTHDSLAERGYYLKLLNINHWDIAIETIRRNIAFAEMYNATIENWGPQQYLQGQRPHLLVAAPECIMYSKARGNKKEIRDQSRTTAAWVIDWVKMAPHALYFENVEEWQTWGKLDDELKPIPEYKGEYFDSFVAEIKSLGYSNFKYGVFNCADYGDPTTRKRLFCTAWHDEYCLAPSVPQPTHTKYPGKYPWLKKWVPIRECLDLNRPSEFITDRDTIHAPATIRRISSGFTSQKAWDSPLYGEICARLLPIAEHAHAQLNARPSEKKLGRKLTKNEVAGKKRILEALRAEQRGTIAEACARPLAHFEPNDVPQEIIHALATLVGQHAGSGPRTIDDPAMTITGGAGPSVAQPFLAKANASEKSAFNDATQSIDVPKRTTVTKDCTALAQGEILSDAALVVVRHGKDDIRTPSLNDPTSTVTTKNELGIAQGEVLADTTIVHLYSWNIKNGTATSHATSSPDEPCSTISAGGNHHGLGQGFIARCYGEKPNDNRTHSLDEPARTIGAGGNQNALTQGFITKNYGERHADENRTTELTAPIDAIPASAKHGLAQGMIVSRNNAEKGDRRARSFDEPGGTTTKRGLGYLCDSRIFPQHFDSAPQTPEDTLGAIVAIDRHGLAQPSIVSNHFNNESQSLEEPGCTATTATGGGMGLTQPVVTQNFGERTTQKPRSRTIDESSFTATGHGAGMLAQTEAAATPASLMFFFTIGETRYYINIRYRMLHSSELAKAHSLGHVNFAGTESDAIRQIGNSIPARTAAAFIGHQLAPVFARLAIPTRKTA
jgi:site-specific DNA-cytosine methylase